jgi:hypothetical protein
MNNRPVTRSMGEEMKLYDRLAASSDVGSRICVLLLLTLTATPGSVWAQDFSVKKGETIDIYPVYWVTNCRSRLLKLEGIDLLEGPPSIVLALRQQTVYAAPQKCPNPVPGAMVTLTAQSVAAKFSGMVGFRVRYSTEDGSKQSTHRIKLDIY